MNMRPVVTAVFLWVHVKNHAQERRHSSHCKFLSLVESQTRGLAGTSPSRPYRHAGNLTPQIGASALTPYQNAAIIPQNRPN